MADGRDTNVESKVETEPNGVALDAEMFQIQSESPIQYMTGPRLHLVTAA